MPRRPLTLAAGLSLLLCVATVALWVRSYGDGSSLDWGEGVDTGYGWILHSNRIGVRGGVAFYTHSRAPMVSLKALGPGARYNSRAFVGVEISRGYWPLVPDGDRSAFRTALTLPMWLPALVTAPLPGWWMTRLVKQRQRSLSGLCPACGYDLRATPDRCPECGAVPAAPAAR